MKTILFLTTANASSDEHTDCLWNWPTDSSGCEVECAIAVFPSPADAGVEWQVKAFKSIDCDKRYNREWQYGKLKETIATHCGSGECAIFFHADDGQLTQLKNCFSEEERENYIFERYSSVGCPFFGSHIVRFAKTPTSENFENLWNEIIEPLKKKAIINTLCQLRYELLAPLLARDLLSKHGCSEDVVQGLVCAGLQENSELQGKIDKIKAYFTQDDPCKEVLEKGYSALICLSGSEGNRDAQLCEIIACFNRAISTVSAEHRA
jgi:hypothetical protein